MIATQTTCYREERHGETQRMAGEGVPRRVLGKLGVAALPPAHRIFPMRREDAQLSVGRILQRKWSAMCCRKSAQASTRLFGLCFANTQIGKLRV